MHCKVFSMVMVLSIVLLTSPSWSQDLIVYPAKGQSNDQMEKDKYECYTWAKGQTGFDPKHATLDHTAAHAFLLLRRRRRGGGAVIGGIAGGSKGARRGAAIGGLSGGAIGGMRSSNQNRQADQQRKQWEQEQANQYMQRRNEYNRAHAACLEGRGYTVK